MPEILRKRLELLTSFSRTALHQTLLSEVLDEACHRVRDGVDAKFVKVLKRTAGEDFLLITGVGFDPADYGKTILPGGPRSPLTQVIDTRTPVRIRSSTVKTGSSPMDPA
jgi:hypothetical protein